MSNSEVYLSTPGHANFLDHRSPSDDESWLRCQRYVLSCQRGLGNARFLSARPVRLAAKAASAGHRLVLVAGGDGTLGEAAGRLAHSDCILAPLPGGTGNSFAKELGMPLRGLLGKHDLARSCDAHLKGSVRLVDLGLCNEITHWLQWTGIGVDGHFAARIEPRNRWKRRAGSLGYIALGLPALLDFRGTIESVSIDGKMFDLGYVMVTICNCRGYAGGQIILNPEAILDDGYFEVCLFEGDGFRDVSVFLVDLLLGRHLNNPRMMVVRGREIESRSTLPSPIHHDCDLASHAPMQCRMAPGALRLVAPDTAPKDLFLGPAESYSI